MKNRLFLTANLGLGLTFLLFTGGCARQAKPSPVAMVPAVSPDVDADKPLATTPAPPPPDPAPAELDPPDPAPAQLDPPDPAPTDAAAETRAASAAQPGADPAKPAPPPNSTERVSPPRVRSTGPVADLIKLADSGVNQEILMAYVTSSPSLFNPSADEIIYLTDRGVPSAVVAAMLRRDQALREARAAVPAPAAPQGQPAPEPAVAPVAVAVQTAAPPSAAPLALNGGEVPPDGVLPAPPEDAEAMFYESLEPYGNWVDVEGYGPCWQPSIQITNPTWQPYVDGGQWIYSDCGWYWLSSYSWGWAPYHYGRWFHHHRWGWCWLPDTVWAPSWVCWRFTGGYCGWAPLPPGVWFRPGIGLCFRGRPVGLGFTFGLRVDAFAFVPWGHFQDRQLRNHRLPLGEAEQAYRQSTVASYFESGSHGLSNRGPSTEQVSAATGRPIRPVAIHEVTSRPGVGVRGERLTGGGRTLDVVRPPVSRSAGPGTTAARETVPWNQSAAALRAARPAQAEWQSPRVAGIANGWNRQATASRLEALQQSAAAQTRSGPAPAAERWPPARRQYWVPAPSEYRSPAPSQYPAPAYSAPAYSPPANPVPRANPTPPPESRPAASAPAPAPAPAPAAHSSSQRNGR